MSDLEDIEIFDDDVTGKEIVRKLRSEIPRAFKTSNDARIQWLWSQRLAVVQSVKLRSKDPLDVLAATIILQAAMSGNLDSIALVFQRLEGGAVTDEEELEKPGLPV